MNITNATGIDGNAYSAHILGIFYSKIFYIVMNGKMKSVISV